MARRLSSPAAMLAMFVLGACTTAVVQSSASPDAGSPAESSAETTSPATLAPTVIPLAEAPRAVAPTGKASITHLAQGRNAYLGLLRMDADGAVPVHRDPTEEYIHVLAGGGTMIIDGQTFEVTPGTTIFMPANAEVSFQNGPEELVAVQVFAGPEPAAKYGAWTSVD
jgi:quercetin dioxygenase-like cupin family protein